MQHTFGKRCTGILIKATSPISCIISTSSPPVFVSFLSPWLQVKRQICLKLQPKPKIKASSISWDGCEHSLQRGNTPTRIMVDLGSISSLTTLLAAERWIIKNPPEHGNTHSAGRETKHQYTEKSKFQRGGKKAHAYSKKKKPTAFHSASETVRSNTTFTCWILLVWENFQYKHWKHKQSYTTHGSWRRAILQKHYLIWRIFAKETYFFLF